MMPHKKTLSGMRPGIALTGRRNQIRTSPVVKSTMDIRRSEASGVNDRFALNCLMLLCITVILCSGLRPLAWADDVNMDDRVTIVTPGTEARLCPKPGCGPDQHLTRIPEGTVLAIEGTDVFAIGTFKVKWFEVVYQNQRGWISIYDTDRAQK